jgi:hypothetical protein
MLMGINELRTGLLVQHTTPRGTDLYQVSTIYPQGAALQWVYSRDRGGEDGYLPSRTSVVMFSNREIDRDLRPASTQMANRFQAALDSRRAEVGA